MGCNGLETVTVKDLKHIYQLTFQNCYALTNVTVLARKSPFSGIESFPSADRQFQSCSSWTQPFDFSASTFTSLPTQMFYGAKKIPEFRLPATLTSFNKQALRCDDYALSDPRRIWFYGPPPSLYWKSGDPDYLWYVPTSKPRQTVFVPEQYAAAWKTALSNHGTWSAITDTDRARADYPTKLVDVKVKIRGPKFDLVPSRVKESSRCSGRCFRPTRPGRPSCMSLPSAITRCTSTGRRFPERDRRPCCSRPFPSWISVRSSSLTAWTCGKGRTRS
jgi:hypothetical protein